MAICASIAKYGFTKFHLYILEICPKNLSREQLSHCENNWYKRIKPSYNIQDILQPFSGENHYRFGKTVSAEVRAKISNTLTGRVQSDLERANHSKAQNARKVKVYCYDFDSKLYVTEFLGHRKRPPGGALRPPGMAKELGLSDSIYIRMKLNNGKPFKVTYKGSQVTWLLLTKKL
jgi:hypothetical protein